MWPPPIALKMVQPVAREETRVIVERIDLSLGFVVDFRFLWLVLGFDACVFGFLRLLWAVFDTIKHHTFTINAP
jgi:hypothetical protein